ncbi:MAG TPA: hypothetical protein VI670_26415 [Thermoanaerobaculia bacterium]
MITSPIRTACALSAAAAFFVAIAAIVTDGAAGTGSSSRRRASVIVLDANRMFHETGAREGEYEEFARFSISTTCMTVNCAVKNGNRLQWALMNWNGDDVEFRIRLKLHRCGKIADDVDESS